MALLKRVNIGSLLIGHIKIIDTWIPGSVNLLDQGQVVFQTIFSQLKNFCLKRFKFLLAKDRYSRVVNPAHSININLWLLRSFPDYIFLRFLPNNITHHDAGLHKTRV